MEAKDELIKARVVLQKENPFFSYLTMGLNLIEDKEIDTAGVDMRGNLYYNPKFIDKLNHQQVKTLLSHEVLHIALQHLVRVGERNKEGWNIATDLVINNTLTLNGFEFGSVLDKGLVPKNNNFSFGKNIVIKDIDKKIAEEIYNELKGKVIKEMERLGIKGFDVHIFIDDGKGTGEGKDKKEGKGRGISIGKEELEQIQKEWKNRLAEASAYAKLQGKIPAGMDRYIDALLNSKLNWRELLYKYITQEIPIDYTYNSPSKRSQAVGIYMPKVKKELVDITIAIDTSGSIGKGELTEFLSEIVGITKYFESLRLNVMFWDTEIKNHYVVSNGNIDDILNFKITGGGGTDFSSVYNYIRENVSNARLLIFFTDGYASFPKFEEIKTIWALCKNSCDIKEIPFGEVIKIGD